MIKVQFVRRATDDAPAGIAFPYFQLHRRWNDPATRRTHKWRYRQVLLALDRDQLELEDLPLLVGLAPRVHEVEDAVVRPDSSAEFLVDSDPFRSTHASLGLLGRQV